MMTMMQMIKCSPLCWLGERRADKGVRTRAKLTTGTLKWWWAKFLFMFVDTKMQVRASDSQQLCIVSPPVGVNGLGYGRKCQQWEPISSGSSAGWGWRFSPHAGHPSWCRRWNYGWVGNCSQPSAGSARFVTSVITDNNSFISRHILFTPAHIQPSFSVRSISLFLSWRTIKLFFCFVFFCYLYWADFWLNMWFLFLIISGSSSSALGLQSLGLSGQAPSSSSLDAGTLSDTTASGNNSTSAVACCQPEGIFIFQWLFLWSQMVQQSMKCIPILSS